MTSEIYEAHCASEQHKQNIDLCKAFKVPYSGLFSWVENFVKSWKRPPELNFVVLNFVVLNFVVLNFVARGAIGSRMT